MSVQYIEKDGKPEWAVVTVEEYRQLVEAAEFKEDLRLYREAKKTPEEVIPGEVIDQLLDGEGPIRVWRRFRGLSQQELASSIGISKAYLSQLEGGSRIGTAVVLKKIAEALKLTLEEIMPFGGKRKRPPR